MKVNDILSIEGMVKLKVLAGKLGLSREIKTITVLEVAETEGQSWLIEGQLYVTSLYAVRNNVDRQIEIINSLIQANSAGIIICHINQWLKRVDEKIVEICNYNDFPLLVADSDTTYIEILNPVILKLMGDPGKQLEEITWMQKNLIEYVASMKDISTIYKTMSDYYEEKLCFLMWITGSFTRGSTVI